MKNRWVMNRIGLNGYWWFHNLEIEMSEDGNLLINGGNATGKTNTLAAIITPLLDGDTSATRMDAFGAKGKKLRDYVLGVGDSAEESGTCYIFAEFINRCTDETKTLMMGVYDHKTKDSPQKHFWIITDGTRMKMDVPVFIEHRINGQDVQSPVMISQMKSALANSGEYYSRAEEYATAVNRHFYGFAAQEEFKKMIEGLLLIRKSKLNETNNHNAILQNLSDSLQTIDEEVVSGIAEYCRSIEELELRLKNNRDDFQEIKRIKNAYEMLQKSVLAEKAKMYRLETSNLSKIEKSFGEYYKKSEELAKNLNEKQEGRHSLTKNYNDSATFLSLDGIKGLRDLPAQRTELENRKATTTARIRSSNETVDSQEVQLEELEQRVDDLTYTAEEKKTHIIKKAKGTIELGEGIGNQVFDVHGLATNPEGKFYEKIAVGEAKTELAAFKKAKEIIEESERIKGKAEEKENEYESKLVDLKASMKEKEDSSNKVHTLVGELVSDIHSWEKGNAVFIIEKEEDKKKLIQAASLMEEMGGGMRLAAALNDAYLNVQSIMKNTISRLEDDIKKYEEKMSVVSQQIEEIRGHGEVLLKRPNSISLHREMMNKRSVNHIEVYKAFNFKENVSSNMRKNIEYALSAAGLIDTLLVPEDYRVEFMTSHKEESDLFLIVGDDAQVAEANSLNKYLVPEEGAVGLALISQAERFLHSISDSDSKDAKNFIAEDGTFRVGKITGLVDPAYEPMMIGETTRLNHMEKMIGVLELEIGEAKFSIEQWSEKIVAIERELSILNKEKEGFPDQEALEKEKSRLENAERTIGILSEESQRAKSDFEQFSFESKALITQAKGLLKNRQIEYSSLGMSRAVDTMQEIIDNIRELFYEQQLMMGMLEAGQKGKFDMLDKKKLINDTKDNLYEDKKELEKIKSQLEAIIEILDSSEDREKFERIKVCEDIVQSYSENIEKISNEITEISSQLANVQSKIEEQQEKKALTIEKKKVAREMLEKVIQLYKIKESFEEIQATPESLINKSDMQEFESSFNTYRERLNGDFRFELSNENLYNYDGENDEVRYMTSSAKILICKASYPGHIGKKNLSPKELYNEINADTVSLEDAITEKSDAMFREISNSKATRAIFDKYRQSKSYVDDLRKEISSREMAGGLRLFLEWEKNEAFTGGEVNVKDLIKFMTDAAKEKEFSQSIKHYIQYKIDQEKSMAKDEARDVNFEKAVFDALDYRKWFAFKIFYEKDGESKTELTPANYNVLSGGMKSTISYAPLISSMKLLMTKARATAPRLVALDEAFAGVDLDGADMMFEYLESLDFSYIMTSEKLTGLYPAINNISIVTYDKNVKTKEISTLKYYWSKGKHHVFPNSIEDIIEEETRGVNP